MQRISGFYDSIVDAVLQQPIDGAANLIFFKLINDFLRDEISEFQTNLLGRFMELIGVAALSVLTIWIIIQGTRIMTGKSRESLMGLVTDSLRAILIVGIATGMAATNGQIYRLLTDGLGTAIYGTVTSDNSDLEDMYDQMDASLAIMNVAMAKLDSLQTAGDEKLDSEVSRARWMAGLGTAGPAMTAGVMLTLNKIAIALFTGLGPLFIMCLLFEQTKSLFQRWLLYGVGTMFSLAVLYVMVILATDAVVAVATSFWISSELSALTGNEGLKTIALQQGGLGLILTMMLISAPPMAAAFFQGTLGGFMHYSAFESGRGGKDGYRNAPSANAPAGAPVRVNNDPGSSAHQSSGRPSLGSQGGAPQLESQLRSDGQIRSVDEARSPRAS